jgi:hypothetical protein
MSNHWISAPAGYHRGMEPIKIEIFHVVGEGPRAEIRHGVLDVVATLTGTSHVKVIRNEEREAYRIIVRRNGRRLALPAKYLPDETVANVCSEEGRTSLQIAIAGTVQSALDLDRDWDPAEDADDRE